MICDLSTFFNNSLMGLLTRSWNLIAMTYVHSAPLLTRQGQCTKWAIICRLKKTAGGRSYLRVYVWKYHRSGVSKFFLKKYITDFKKSLWCDICISMNLSIITLIIIHVCNVRQGTAISFLRKMYINLSFWDQFVYCYVLLYIFFSNVK